MIKKALLSIVMSSIMAYLAIAITAFSGGPSDLVCRDIELVIKDSVHFEFITKEQVAAILNRGNANPIGQKMADVDLKALEATLDSFPLIDRAECYRTPGGRVHISVTQRPVLRVFADNGENYFVDNKGGIMKHEAECVMHLPIVTGNVEKSFAMRDLYKFALFLQKNKFWDAQIEQINVLNGQEIELVPRVGNHIIFLGKLERYESKLDRLKEFYQKGLNKVGWNKYKRISIEFDNQIICTKRRTGNIQTDNVIHEQDSLQVIN